MQALNSLQLKQAARLRFNPETEARFVERHSDATLGRVRVVFGILVAFGVLGLVGAPKALDTNTAIVDYTFTGIYFVLFALAMSHRFRHLAAPALAASAVMSQIAVGLTSKVLQPELGIVINLMYGIVIIAALQVRFNLALLFSVAMIAARAWTFSYRGMWKDGATLMFVFLVVEFVFLGVGSYLNEVRERKSFLLEESLRLERERSHALVQNVLPPSIADELSRNPGTLARQHDSVTVMFADIVEFSNFAQREAPGVVVGLLNDLFMRFDALTRASSVLKVKTVGDCYMVASGLPEAVPDHVARVADLALEFRGVANAIGVPIRIGFHTGPVIAGVLGTERLMYDLWGPTVNRAARLEAAAEVGQIVVSQDVRDILAEEFELEPLGLRELKGIGPSHVFALQRRKVRGIELSPA